MKKQLKQLGRAGIMLTLVFALVLSATPASAAPSALAASYLTTTDNEDNAGTGVADGDLDNYIDRANEIHPIEFNIVIPVGGLPTTSASLIIRADDVDEEQGEIDEVFVNGTSVGYLYGENGLWSNTVFSLPVSGMLVEGDNLIEIYIDQNLEGWRLEVDYGQLAIDGGGAADAAIDDVSAVCASISDGTVTVTTTVDDTATNAGTYDLETYMKIANGSSPSNDIRQFTRTAGESGQSVFTLTYPLNSSSGSFSIDSSLFNNATALLQSTESLGFTHTVDVGPSLTGCEVTAPEMAVYGLGVAIADGDSDPSVADNTDFGNVLVAGGSSVHTFTITNTGDAVLELGTVSIESSDFTVTAQPTLTTVPVSGATSFTVEFDPSSDGLIEAMVYIPNDDADENPYTFDIQGTGITASTLTLSVSNIAFGDQLAWVKTAPVTVTITNDGATEAIISSTFTRSSGKFLLSDNTCAGATLAIAADCTFDMVFRPTASGAVAGTLTFASDAVNSPHVITLSGNGVAGTQLLANNSFELSPGGVLTTWVGSGITSTDGTNYLYAKSGIKSVLMTGTDWTVKSYTQTINMAGSAGDDFRLTAWSMADAVPVGYLYRAQVSFYDGGSLVQRRIKDFNSGTHDWENVWVPFYATAAYDSVEVEIIYRLPSGTAWFDSVTLYYAP